MKIIVDNYTFNSAASTITFSDYSSIHLNRVLLIVNVTTNTIIYNFANPALGGDVASNVLTLDYDTSVMSSGDILMIQYDDKSRDIDAQVDTDVLNEIRSAVMAVAMARAADSTLRVSGSMNVGTISTITTLNTLTTLANMASVGGYSANQQIPATQNMAAVQSNVNNVIIS